jgi:hypothetical protein
MARYNAVNKRAEEVAAKPFQKYGTSAEDFVAQINQQQQTGINNVNAAAGSYQPYIDAATGATVAGMDEANAAELDINKYMSPYIQNVADTTGAMLAQENERAQSGGLGTAISSGAFGGDRAGIAAANLSQQQNLAYGKTMADIYNQGYGQAVGTAQQQQGVNLGAEQANLARLTAGGAQLAGLGTTAQQAGLAGAEAQINAGTLQQQTEQAGKTALVNQFMQEQGYPFQVAQFLANISMGTGALSGSTTATTQPAPFFSDRRLKHDVKRIGKTDDGLPIYSFKYKGDEKEQTHVGFMADEVEKVKPEAVGVHPTGYKTVDYEKATEKNSMGGGVAPQRAGEAFADGGVAGPYGSSANSQPDFGGYVPQAYLPVGGLMMADPAYAEASNESMAGLMADTADFGTNMLKLDEQFGKGGTFWEAFKRQKEADGGAISAQYLKPKMGGLVPNTEKSYLTDTLASQDKSDKPKLDAAPGAGGGGSSPAGDIASLAKIGLAIAGIPLPFRNGGAAGYADGGAPEEEDFIRGPGLAAAAAERTMPQATRERLSETAPIDMGSDLGAAVRSLGREAVGYQPGKVDPGLASAVGMSPRPALTLGTPVAEAPQPVSTPRPPVSSGLSFGLPAVPTGSDTAGSLRMPAAAPETKPVQEPVGVAAAVVPQGREPAATGVVPPQKGAIIPLNTQLDFVMHELQKPEYSGYLKGEYATPGQAAIAFDKVYERSGGQGNDRAASYAEDVYSAAMGGDMSLLPENAQAAYQHFIDGGMDPIKAAGATGRLMVESYAHMDPNARNTIGGGYGTYGIAQWRGDRMENLASFAGVPLDAITGAPISTPEGRYYASGEGQGVGVSSKNSPEYGGESGEGRGLGLGKFLKENAGNKDFLMSVLSGLGTMASSPSRYLGSAVLQGIGGAANTYMAREQQRSDITAKNLENLRNIAMDTMTWNEMNGSNLTPSQYASMTGAEIDIPGNVSAETILSGAYQPTTGGDGLKKLSYQEFQNGTVDVGGRTVAMQNDPASLQRFINDNGLFPAESPIGRQVQIARDRLNEINSSGGMVTDVSGQQFQIPGYTSVGDTQAKAQADREAAAKFREAAPEEINATSRQLASISTLEGIYSKMESGKFANVGAEANAVLSALDPGNVTGWQQYDLTDPAMYEIAMKGAGEIMAARLQTLPGGAPAAEIDFLSSVTPTPGMQPEAIKKLLAITKAEAQYRMDMYNGYDPSVHGNDINAYIKEFAGGGETFKKYVDDAVASMPKFAGEAVTPQDAEEGSTSVDKDGRPIIKRNGKWEYQ